MNLKIAPCSLALLSCNYYRLRFLVHAVQTDTKRSFVNTLKMERSQSLTSHHIFPVSRREDVLINPNLCSVSCRITRADYWFAYNSYALVCLCVFVCVYVHMCVCVCHQSALLTELYVIQSSIFVITGVCVCVGWGGWDKLELSITTGIHMF